MAPVRKLPASGLVIGSLSRKSEQDENGNIVPGTTIFTAEDDPFVGFAISFPHTNTNCAVSYKVNMVAEYADIEDNFDNENDNTYGD